MSRAARLHAALGMERRRRGAAAVAATMALVASLVVTPALGTIGNVVGVRAPVAAAQTPAPNPPLPKGCDQSIALVFDLSASITAQQLIEMQRAADGMVQQLSGTTTKVGLYTFATYAPATNTLHGTAPAGNLSLEAGPDTDLADPANVTRVQQRINGITKVSTTGTPSPGFTNWDRGLAQIAEGSVHYGAVVFITDGNPTAHGPPPGTTPNTSPTPTGTTRPEDIDAAVTSANALKALGTRVIAIGVSDTTGPSVDNLKLISGDDAGSDYFLTDFDDLRLALGEIATKACGNTVTIVKDVHHADGTVTEAAGGWTYTSPTSGVTPPRETTVAEGGAAFEVPKNSTVSFHEVEQAGFTFVDVVCHAQTGEDDLDTEVRPTTPATPSPGWNLSTGSEEIITCTVTNDEQATLLTLVKHVVGEAPPEDWTLHAAGPISISGHDGQPSVTAAQVRPGTYTLSESDGPDFYRPSDWTCTGASAFTADTVTLTTGENATCSITNTQVPQLRQNKTVDKPLALAGDQLTYTVTVTNLDQHVAADNVVATDVLSRDVTFVSADTHGDGTFDATTGVWTIGTIPAGTTPAGTTVTLTLVVTIDPTVAAGSTVTNMFRVTPEEDGPPVEVENACPSPDTDYSCADTLVLNRFVQTKTVNLDVAEPGDTLTYTLGVANLPPPTGTTIPGPIIFSDTLPPNVTFVPGSATVETCTGPSPADCPTTAAPTPVTQTASLIEWSLLPGGLAPDEQVFLRFRVTVNANAPVGSTQTNIFVAAPPPGTPPPEVENVCAMNMTASCASTDIIGVPRLTQNKTVDRATAEPGDTLRYTITVRNRGTTEATGVVGRDVVPEGVTFVSANTHGHGTFDHTTGVWDIGTLAVGARATLTITVTVKGGARGTVQTNLFSVDPPGNAPDEPPEVMSPCPPPDQDASCADTAIPGVPQLIQTKVVDRGVAGVGDTLHYTLTVSNRGSAAATGVTAQDTLPPGVSFVSAIPSQGRFDPSTGTWTIGTIGKGETVTLVLIVRVGSSAINTTQVNQFDVVPPTTGPPPIVEEPCPGSPTDSCADTEVRGSPQILQSKTATKPLAIPGSEVTYQLSLTDIGNGHATDISAQDVLPRGLTLVSVNTHRVGTFSTKQDVWTIPFLQAGHTAVMILAARVDDSTPLGTILTNELVVKALPGSKPSSVQDPCPGNRSDSCAIVEVVGPPLPSSAPPPATTTTTTPPVTTPTTTPTTLPVTGTNTPKSLLAALSAIALGAFLVAAARRRRRT